MITESVNQPPQLNREAGELLELAEEAGRIGIFEWVVTTGALNVSAKFLSLYGMTDFDGRYDSWLTRIYREDVPRLRDTIERALAEQATQLQVEFRIIAGDAAPRWMELRGITFYAGAAPLRVVGVSVDITERKRATVQLHAFAETLEERVRERTRELEAENEARLKAEELLRQAQKMEAVGQLTGGVAHDFNNLLTVVLGGLDSIGRQIPMLGHSAAAERIARAQSMALQGVRRAATLTSRLLAFSRQQALVPKALDANQLVAGVCEMLRRTLGESVTLESVFGGGLWRIHADSNQLENAIVNLAVNARDAMPQGGRLTIETSNCYLSDAYVATLPEPVDSGQYVLIAVSDTGSGMDAATVERAFEPFYTTKGVGKGTGLGLSQVYGFVRQSAGHVKIYSELGQGTSIKIYLPRYLGSGPTTEEQSATVEAVGLRGTETVLLVEDDDVLRAYAAECLTELGYRVLVSSHGSAALEILKDRRQIDLLFTDVVMPGMTGRQLADEALRLRPTLKVLYATGYTRNAMVHHGRLDPGVQMINKPFSYDELAASVRKILDEN